MKFSKEVVEIVSNADMQNPTDPESAIDAAMAGLRELPDYDVLVSRLVRHAVQDLIYDSRHAVNVQVKQQAGKYSPKPKVVVGSSAAVLRVEQSVFNYRIAGTVLGELMGEQLLGIAVSEESRAEGYLFNASLCRRLSEIVPEGKKVGKVMSKKRLTALFDELKPEVKETVGVV